MQISNIPPKFPLPFAASAGGPYITFPIPTPSQIGIGDGRASLHDGFPPLCFTAIAAGGKPPFGEDFQGILYWLSLAAQWQQATGGYPYDATWQAAVGGYPVGGLAGSLTIPGMMWRSTVDNNLTNPDAAGAGWVVNHRVALAADLNLYVAQNGSDASGNFGLSSGSPLALLQTAVGIVNGSYDLRNSNVNIHLIAGGTNTFGPPSAGQPVAIVRSPFVGGTGIVTIVADSAVTVAGGTGNGIEGIDGASFEVSGPMTLTGRSGIAAFGGANIYAGAGLVYGTTTVADIEIEAAQVQRLGNDTISGSTVDHVIIRAAGQMLIPAPITTTLSGTPSWSDAFINTFADGVAFVPGWTFTPGPTSATGRRFETATAGGIYTGSSPTPNVDNGYLAGNSAGVCNTVGFGWYD